MFNKYKLQLIAFSAGFLFLILSHVWTILSPFGVLQAISPETSIGKFLILTSSAYSLIFWQLGINLIFASFVSVLINKIWNLIKHSELSFPVNVSVMIAIVLCSWLFLL